MKRILIFCLMVFPAACDSEGDSDSKETGAFIDSSSDSSSQPTEKQEASSDIDTTSAQLDSRDTQQTAGNDTATGTESDTTVRDITDTSNIQIFCPDGKQMHTTTSGKVICCTESYPLFCDENENGYTGSCWGADVDCDSITFCGDAWHACRTGSLPYCDTAGNMICIPCANEAAAHYTQSGMPVCCSEPTPLFCDENANGFPGGCWSSQLDCSTIIWCNDHWSACSAGATPVCENGIVTCQIN